MKHVNVCEAKAHLARLLDRAAAGEEVVITRHGRPVAVLGPVREKRNPRRLGLLRGKVRFRPDFDAPLPGDILDAFEGNASLG